MSLKEKKSALDKVTVFGMGDASYHLKEVLVFGLVASEGADRSLTVMSPYKRLL